jgi:Transglutaminase-like superfamily
MFRRLQRFSRLAPSARSQFLRAAAILPLLKLSLKWRGLQATRRMLERHSNGKLDRSREIAGDETPQITARMVRAAARHGMVRPSCLEESLTLWWLLARQGIVSQLRIGVRKPEKGFEAHAWVERDGVPLNESQPASTQFAVFDADLSHAPRNDR